MGRPKKLNVKPNKHGDNPLSLRVRTSDLMVLREAMLHYRKHMRNQYKTYPFESQEALLCSDLISSSTYLLARIDQRFEYDLKYVEPKDRDFYNRVRVLYKGVR